MQLLKDWDPLNLPRGSIRALVTLVLLGVLWAQMVLDREVRPELAYLILLIVGHYFGARSRPADGGRSPLGLPRGTIRTLIVLGFGFVGYQLWQGGRLDLDLTDQSVAILFLVGALLLGFLVRKSADLLSRGKATVPRQWFENLKSVVVIIATGLLAFCSFFGQDEPLNQNVTLVAAPVVGFYFGSRH